MTAPTNYIYSSVPPGSQKGQEILFSVLSSRVLENIAGLTEERVFYGQARPDRPASRRRFPEVSFYEGQPPAGRYPGHHHFWPELATVVEGDVKIAIAQEMYSARRGDWLALRPEVVHGECCAETRTAYQLVWFELDRPYPNLHLSAYKPGQGYESFGIFGLPQLPPFLRASAKELVAPPWPPVSQARLHLLRLVNWIMELLDQSLHPKLSRGRRKVLEVQERISRSQEDHPTVKGLAAQVGLSTNYLSTLFHAHTGITIRQYITYRQVEKAKSLLADPSCTIKEVAYRLGFQNPCHFSKVFRCATGIRPGVYQLRLRSDPARSGRPAGLSRPS